MENYYQGDDISVAISGDSTSGLDNIDFHALFYRGEQTGNYISYAKTDMTRTGENAYKLVIDHSVTATLAVGSYTMEIFDATGYCINKMKALFSIEDSASKNLILTDNE